MSAFPPETTIADLRAWWKANLLKGAVCPVCKRPGKVRRRSISGNQAAALVIAVELHERTGEPIYTRGLSTKAAVHKKRGGFSCPDFPSLRHWGLIKRVANKNKDKSHSGLYIVTQLAIDWVRGDARIPNDMNVYRDKAQQYQGSPLVTLGDRLGKKFSLERLLASVANAVPDAD